MCSELHSGMTFYRLDGYVTAYLSRVYHTGTNWRTGCIKRDCLLAEANDRSAP